MTGGGEKRHLPAFRYRGSSARLLVCAKRVKNLMESAASEWENIKASTTAQCERLEQVSNDLQDRFAWRVGRTRRTFAADSGERTPDGKPKLFRLVDPTETRIRRHVKVKSEANPFDPRWRDYFEDRAFFKRMGIHRHEAGIKPS
jgi:hypothetical protein